MVSLWGFMGSGKTTVGEAFARQYGWKHIDTDDEIEKEQKMSIPDIFAIHGETYFRKLETALLEKLVEEQGSSAIDTDLASRKIVLTTGGGMPMSSYNRTLLHKLGDTFFVDVSFTTITERLKGKTGRPLWNEEHLEQMRLKYEERYPLYREAKHTLHADQLSVREIVAQIYARIASNLV